MADKDLVSDELWHKFRRVVSMTSGELREWLEVRDEQRYDLEPAA